MGNDRQKAEETLVIIDASLTQASSPEEFLLETENSDSSTSNATTQFNKESWEPIIGTEFDGKYKIEEKIGEGGMGLVYRANHIFIDRPVAIKFLRQEYLTDTAAIERFKLEARAAARIQHPNVTTILDFGISGGTFYLVMEYLEGFSLRKQLKTNGALSLKDTIRIMLQVCDALDAAHKSNIIHKDLKPDNIYIHIKDGIEQVKVLDFGIAEIVGRVVNEADQTFLAGTPHYMSPEQYQNDPVSPATDIYSLGVILFEMLTGQLPFDEFSPVSLALRHLSSPPPKLTSIDSSIPIEFEEIVNKALAKQPERRYQTALELAEDLQKSEKITTQFSVAQIVTSESSAICSNPKCGQSGLVGNRRCPTCQALAVGSLLRHRYLIDKMVGKGGFGTTYLVKDLDCFEEQRILKELTLSLKDEDPMDLKDMAERLFRREAQVLLNLYHSGIPRLYAYFAEENFSYLVQDFIPGQTLSEEFKKRKSPLSEEEVMPILASLADILDYLHSHTPPVIHRDIKPHNLMRHQDGRIMLIDFGAVCQAAASPNANHTVIGSLGYAPPEQFLGQTTIQSDLYAVGASVIYLLTGVPPRLLLSNSNTDKLDKELMGKISPQLLALLKELVTTQVEARLPNTLTLKKRLASLNNTNTDVSINNKNQVETVLVNINDSKAQSVINNTLQSPAPQRPSLSGAFAKITSGLPSTPSSNNPSYPSSNTPSAKTVSSNSTTFPSSLSSPSSVPTIKITEEQSVARPNINSTTKPTPSSTPSLFQALTPKPLPAIVPQQPSSSFQQVSKPLSSSQSLSSPSVPQQAKVEPANTPVIDFQAAAQLCYEVESMLRTIDYGTHFAVLGISSDATSEQVIAAYRELANKFNPSKYLHLSSYNPSLQTDLKKIFSRLKEAFETLIDPNKRSQYNRIFRTGTFEKLK
ncbi:MAG: protein kinase [Acidobacteria bacterium]|nr:protein kinase [Acidobacteriota bacterium]